MTGSGIEKSQKQQTESMGKERFILGMRSVTHEADTERKTLWTAEGDLGRLKIQPLL